MDEDTRPALDSEAPVNPYSLLEAVNRASRSTGRAWLAFLALASYLALVLAGITHTHLLLNADVRLPILQLDVGLTRFFVWAPLVLLAAHIALLGQTVLLARKALAFDAAVRLLESTDERSHPLRLEMDSFFLVQALAGPRRSRVVSAYLNGLGWLTVIGLPILLLLYLQVAFLPYHDAQHTLLHQGVLIADLVALALFGVFLLSPEEKYFSAFVRGVAHNPGSLALGIIVLGAAAFLSIFVATVPDVRDRHALFAATDGSLFGIFPRNIVASDKALLAGKVVVPGRASVDLRGRDLRNARLERSDLRQADLTGANLDGASLAGADLRGAVLECAGVEKLAEGVDRGAADCTRARFANLVKARMDGARMAGIDLRGARLDGASLEAADIAHGLLNGASFQNARLARAALSAVNLQGANLRAANLQGADLNDARLQLADLSEARLQGADLARATLDGAMLRSAVLDGADLRASRLYGADLSGASVAAADLSSAHLWHAVPPLESGARLADLTRIVIKAPSDVEVGFLKAALASLDSGRIKDGVRTRIGPLTDAAGDGTWPTEPDGLTWAKLVRDGEEAGTEAYRNTLTSHLADLACRAAFADGAVASGIAKRGVRQGFKGDSKALYARLTARECPAAGAVGQQALRSLAASAEEAARR